ncbi:MAG: putative DNA modification/repair radical SAM protein [Thermoplasmata archaeon]|nr:putative DNA modification/repair radical SAM protein [Thermoplasmata archaeon]
MGLHEKVRILSDAGKYDICASTSCANPPAVRPNASIGNVMPPGVCHSFTPDGRCVSLFKVLYTNACSMDCTYCTNPTCHRKESFQPKELCDAFMSLYMRNYVEGMFLSSGIARDPERTMDDILEAIELLRNKYRFGGYVHLKILPGANLDQIKRATAIADRVSINVEAPSSSLLSSIASNKEYGNDILLRQRWIKESIKKGGAPAGQTTQFVVGAAGENDREIIDRLWMEYRDMKLKRGYFSAFNPIKETPMEKEDGTPLWREHRLYQTDWLLRVYKFPRREVYGVLDDDGMLENMDPKLALARRTFDRPVDPNEADYRSLLRIPGIGPTSASRILEHRKRGGRIENIRTLKSMGAVANRARPFLMLNGWQASMERWWS